MEKFKLAEIKNGSGYASSELREQIIARMEKENLESAVTFSYTDYGGEFFDKVCCDYFNEKYKDDTLSEKTCYYGMNLWLFGGNAEEFWEITQDYLLGFNDIEDYYFGKESEAYDEFVANFLSDNDYGSRREAVEAWLNENKRGDYRLTTQGVDYCETELIRDLERAGLPLLYYRLWDRQCQRYLSTGYNSEGFQELRDAYTDYKTGCSDTEDADISHYKALSDAEIIRHIEGDEFYIESENEKFEEEG